MIVSLFLFSFFSKDILSLFFYTFAFSEEKLGTVEVIGLSPLPGILIEKDKHPSTSQSINENDIKKNLFLPASLEWVTDSNISFNS